MSSSEAEPRVLIVADNASARFGGEAILPLHYFRHLRERGVEAWLIVHERVLEELQGLFPDDLDRIAAVPDLPIHRALYRIGSRLPHRIASNTTGLAMLMITQTHLKRLATQLVRQHLIDVVHVPAPVSPKAPSAIFGVGAPVIFGPLNGGMTFPAGFEHFQGRFERTFFRAARASSALFNQALRGKAEAAAILVANQRTREALPAGVCDNVIELVENGVDFDLFQSAPTKRSERARPRFVYLGRLVDWKAVDMLLDALAMASKNIDMELEIIGDGEERVALDAQVRRLGLGDRVTFRGFVPQTECPAILADSDGLVLPSLYECGGAVVLEAMAMGLPVMATRWGGPADYLDDDTGVLVDPLPAERFVQNLANGLERLAGSEALRAELGRKGLERVKRSYSWAHKIDRIQEIYRSVLSAESSRAPKAA